MANFLARHARRLEEPLHIDLFIGLDLSSRTDQVGIWNNTARPELRRFFAPFGRRFSGYASTLDSAAVGSLVNGITPIKGLDWSAYMPGAIAANSQLALEGGLISLGLDHRERRPPADRFAAGPARRRSTTTIWRAKSP